MHGESSWTAKKAELPVELRGKGARIGWDAGIGMPGLAIAGYFVRNRKLQRGLAELSPPGGGTIENKAVRVSRVEDDREIVPDVADCLG
jgi:hypothetical protein